MTAPELIVDHVWRPPHVPGARRAEGSRLTRPCEFMNCRRPRAEHERATTGRSRS